MSKNFQALWRQKKVILRVQLLQFLKFEEIAKMALFCRELGKLIDPNRELIVTDNQLNIISEKEGGSSEFSGLSLHFTIVL